MRPILLDTQLMVLLVAGLTSVDIIPKHKKLSSFTVADFDLLVQLLGTDPKLILLPNTVSESANLLRQHKNPERYALMETFRLIINKNEEHYIASVLATQASEYHRLGIADVAILECATSSFILLTADAELYVAAERRGLAVTNFNHARVSWGIV